MKAREISVLQVGDGRNCQAHPNPHFRVHGNSSQDFCCYCTNVALNVDLASRHLNLACQRIQDNDFATLDAVTVA